MLKFSDGLKEQLCRKCVNVNENKLAATNFTMNIDLITLRPLDYKKYFKNTLLLDKINNFLSKFIYFCRNSVFNSLHNDFVGLSLYLITIFLIMLMTKAYLYS